MYDRPKKLFLFQYKSTTLSCNKMHYDKLRILFQRYVAEPVHRNGTYDPSSDSHTYLHTQIIIIIRHGQQTTKQKKKQQQQDSQTTPAAALQQKQEKEEFDRCFHIHVYALLLRMSALAGGTDRGGGFQGAINEECFEVLLKYFDCRMECFASPLNCR